MYVIAGTLELSDPKSIYKIENVTCHPDYNETDSWINDIALVKVTIILQIIRHLLISIIQFRQKNFFRSKLHSSLLRMSKRFLFQKLMRP